MAAKLPVHGYRNSKKTELYDLTELPTRTNVRINQFLQTLWNTHVHQDTLTRYQLQHWVLRQFLAHRHSQVNDILYFPCICVGGFSNLWMYIPMTIIPGMILEWMQVIDSKGLQRGKSYGQQFFFYSISIFLYKVQMCLNLTGSNAPSYSISQEICTRFCCALLCCGYAIIHNEFTWSIIHIHQGCFAGTGAIVRLPQCQWSKPDGYGKISQCITTTKYSKAKTVCIFLGIYCTHPKAIINSLRPSDAYMRR